MENLLRRLWTGKAKVSEVTTVQIETPKAVKPKAEAIRCALDIVRRVPTLSSEMDATKFYGFMAQSGFGKSDVDAVIAHFSGRTLWLDSRRNRICCDSSLWSCSSCGSFQSGDSWHLQTKCLASGRSLQILSNVEGKTCPHWNWKDIGGS